MSANPLSAAAFILLRPIQPTPVKARRGFMFTRVSMIEIYN
jgi:hypothetical protein